MAKKLTYIPNRVIDSNGISDGAMIAVYQTGTSTEVSLYSDSALTTPTSNPFMVPAGAPVPPIYHNFSGNVRVVITPANGSDVEDYDPYESPVTDADFNSLRESGPFVSVFEWLTPQQIADVENYTGALNLTASIQEAMDESWASNRNLYFPAGLYNVTGLVIPGNAANRNRGWKMIGQGHGEAFARPFTNGAIIQSSVVGTPVIRVEPDLVPAGVGTYEIAGFRFEQTNNTATAPIAWFKSMYGPCNIHDNTFYQAGTGHGVLIDFCATTSFERNYILGPNWGGGGTPPATSIGLWVRNVTDAGLMTISKITSRGFQTGYKIGDTDVAYDGQVISTAIRDCESSYNVTGIVLVDAARKTTISNFYCEGGLGGVGVDNGGQQTTVENSLFFFGHSKAIYHRNTARGAVYSGNMISLGNANTAAANPIGIDIEGGDYNCVVQGGNIIHDPDSFGPVVNAIGVRITGADPRVDVIGVDFQPPGEWVLANGAEKIKTSTVTGGGVIGTVTGAHKWAQYPDFRGGIALANGPTHLAADMTGNTLTLHDGSFFSVYNDGATIDRFDQATNAAGRLLMLRILGTVQLVASAYVFLKGNKTFSGNDNRILLFVDNDGTDTYAYEISRFTSTNIGAADKAALVTDPTGGATVDAEARAQLVALIDSLQAAGIMNT